MVEWIKDNQIIVSALFLLPASIALSWVKLRERLWSLSKRRRNAARKLFQDGRWRKAARLDYHFAMHDAFGWSLEPVELAYIESRQLPVRLIRDVFGAGGWVRFVDGQTGYVDTRSQRAQDWVSFKATAVMTFIAASLGVPVVLACAIAAWMEGGPIAAVVVAILGGQLVLLLGLFSFSAEAAHRVLSPNRNSAALPLPPKAGRKRKSDSHSETSEVSGTSAIL
ncbi:MAG: hypothetical protein JOZ06_02940 [Paludibacterium sp.]|nr:hypothetical protein [Paludibacterium sp.]